MSYEYFEKSSKIDEKLIREQGDDVCRNAIDKMFIDSQRKEYDFGFIRKTQIAQIGQTRSRRMISEQRISSFVLCKVLPVLEAVDIGLICVRPSIKDGANLIDLVSKKADEMGYKKLVLFSTAESKLINWYKKQGFVVIRHNMPPCGEKMCYMQKLL